MTAYDMRISDWSSDVCCSGLGMQVVVICPTTLLARQHHMNFEERFRGFPVKIGRLSRLVPDKEAKAVKAGLADGTVDIVVGTHAQIGRASCRERVGQ